MKMRKRGKAAVWKKKALASMMALMFLVSGMSISVYGETKSVQLIGPGEEEQVQNSEGPGAIALVQGSEGPGAIAPVQGSEGPGAIAPVQNDVGPGQAGITAQERELRGIWISYLEWADMPKGEQEFKQAADAMLDRCVSWGMNTIFLHAHSHTDATYPSDILPWSKYVSGAQGINPGYDPFGYFVQAAHARGLQIHAWFNPYRVTGYQMSWGEVSPLNPAKQWLSDGILENDRWVLLHEGQYYLNPSILQVQDLVVASVREVLQKYEVDGIHFDDYFYPAVDDSRMDAWFDRPEYEASGSTLSLADWRRENVSQLIAKIYRVVKEERPGAVFGVSPQGFLDNLRSDSELFVDIDRWMSSAGYVDYIMPQLYWGFEAKTINKLPAPYAFQQNLASWIQLKQTGNVKLYLGLGMYRAGTNVADYNEVSEWLRYNDIIKRQVEAGRASGQVAGYCFFSYSSFLEATSAGEVANLVSVLQ